MHGLFDSCGVVTRGALIATCLWTAAPATAQIAPDGTALPALAVGTQPIDAPSIDARSVAMRSADVRSADVRSREGRPRPLLVEAFTRVVKDPTTYALPPIVYTAHRLDWDSSQKLFAHGYLEANPKFTLTGRVDDVPISHAAGKRRILRYSASMIGRSALNNGICAMVERRLIERAPHRRKLIRTLGWIERGLVSAYWSYRLTHNQVGQWRDNERVLGMLQNAAAAPPSAIP
jgi:hypothetical protein